MKDWLKKNYKRVWVSGVFGLCAGLVADLLSTAIFGGLNGYIQFAFVVGGAVAGWYILKNNKGFGKV